MSEEKSTHYFTVYSDSPTPPYERARIEFYTPRVSESMVSEITQNFFLPNVELSCVETVMLCSPHSTAKYRHRFKVGEIL